MSWTPDHPGGLIRCDTPSCTRTRRNYCPPTERERWSATTTGGAIVDKCPQHREPTTTTESETTP